ncbi:MAG: 50S ribosomal protein L5 [Nitrososphaerota archaeon]|nr:50S ribosomal protein L5 [Nitrososphaerota archaeon]MDG6922539.1 50S ribosomal protein L5 [Nitrososphaerota archaeon]
MSETTTIQEHKIDAADQRRIRIGKVVLNIGVGRSGEAIERARRVIEDLVKQKASSRKAKRSIRDFGVHKGEPIGMMVTIRRDKAPEVLKLLLQARENRIPSTAFDEFGNCSFGIKEHIEIPGVRYSPEIGIFGMNVSAVLERSGFRVARRNRAAAKVGRKHRVGREEALEYFKTNFGVEVV